ERIADSAQPALRRALGLEQRLERCEAAVEVADGVLHAISYSISALQISIRYILLNFRTIIRHTLWLRAPLTAPSKARSSRATRRFGGMELAPAMAPAPSSADGLTHPQNLAIVIYCAIIIVAGLIRWRNINETTDEDRRYG